MKEEIMNLPIGKSIDWKFGLISRDVYRISHSKFEITETSGSWVTVVVNIKQMEDILDGKSSILDLVWN